MTTFALRNDRPLLDLYRANARFNLLSNFGMHILHIRTRRPDIGDITCHQTDNISRVGLECGKEHICISDISKTVHECP